MDARLLLLAGVPVAVVSLAVTCLLMPMPVARRAAVFGTAVTALCALSIRLVAGFGEEMAFVPNPWVPPLLWLALGPVAWSVAGAALVGALGTWIGGLPRGRHRRAAGLLVLAGVGSLLPVLWLAAWLAAAWINGASINGASINGGWSGGYLQYVLPRMKLVFGIFQSFYLLPALAFPACMAAAVMTLRPPASDKSEVR